MLRKKHGTLKNMLNSDSFKTVLFTLVLSSAVKLTMDLCGRKQWYSVWQNKLFTVTQSTLLYYGILAVALLLYFVSIYENKCWKHIIVLSLIPFGVYMSFVRYKMNWIHIIATVLCVLLMLLDIWILWICSGEEFRRAVNFHEKLMIGAELFREFFWRVNKNAAFFLMFTLGLSVYAVVLSGFSGDRSMREPIAYANNVRDLQSTTPTNLWEPNKESLRLLAEDVYCTLDTQERLDALQELVNIECEYLGIESRQLIMEDLSDTSMGGYYRDEDRIISIGQEYVERDSSLYGLHILLHEVYHSYQHECVRAFQALKESGAELDMSLKYYRDCAKWEEEFDNYYAGSDDKDFAKKFEEYYQYAAQNVETAANEYRNTWLGEYWEYINDIGKDEMTPEEVIQEVN